MEIQYKLEVEEVLVFDYTNWEGKFAEGRRARITHMYFGVNQYHREPQWIMIGVDLDKNQIRHYAVKDMVNVKVEKKKSIMDMLKGGKSDA
jgi:hypothetical protein